MVHPQRNHGKSNSGYTTRNAPTARGRVIRNSGTQGMHVKKREFIGDVAANATTRDGRRLWKVLNDGSNGPLTFLSEIAGNLGLTASFPWISTVAKNFERYVVHMMDFKYEPSCPSTTSGTLALCPSYNAGDTAPIQSKQDVLDRKDTVRTNLWSPATCKLDPKMMNGVTKEHFVRSGPVPTGQDIKSFDKFKLSALVEAPTGSNADESLGEMWVDYDVELINPLPEKEKFVSNFIHGSFHPTTQTTIQGTDPWVDILPDTMNNGLNFQVYPCDAYYAISVDMFTSFGQTAATTFVPGPGISVVLAGQMAEATNEHVTYYLKSSTDLPRNGYFVATLQFGGFTGAGGLYKILVTKISKATYEGFYTTVSDPEFEKKCLEPKKEEKLPVLNPTFRYKSPGKM